MHADPPDRSRHRAGFTRRDFLRVGGMGLASCGLPVQGLANTAVAGPNAERSVILLLLVGGPSQLETFDPKPDAPAGIRGPFRSIATRIPGIRVSELLPLLAARMDRVALVRSVHHEEAPIHETGYQLLQTGRLCRAGEEAPHFGSVVARIDGAGRELPTSVILPGAIASTGVDIPRGQSAGCLGACRLPTRSILTSEAEYSQCIRSLPAGLRGSGFRPVACWRAGWSRQGPGGDGQHVRDGLRRGLLGLPRLLAVQHVRRLRPRADPDLRSGLCRAPAPPGEIGPSGIHARRRGGRVRPLHRGSMPRAARPLAGRLDRRPRRRWYSRRPGRRASDTTPASPPTGPSHCPTFSRRSTSASESTTATSSPRCRPMPLVQGGRPIHELFAGSAPG